MFSIYTNSLLHAKNVMHKYKSRETALMGGAANDEINIHSLQSLLSATSLTAKQVEDYVKSMQLKMFEPAKLSQSYEKSRRLTEMTMEAQDAH